MTRTDLQELFTPVTLGRLTLPNRIVMAPMTRSRAGQPGDIPTALMATHYAQRAGAGLIVTEASQISPEGKGYTGTPGIYSTQQRDGWRLTTDAVHAAGGHIFLQIWHVGRVSHVSVQPDGKAPVSASAVQARDTNVYLVDADGNAGFVACSAPRALTTAEIARVVGDYRQAARLAIQAGFDGVEIHGANGYLIEQFLRRNSNLREDGYGGTPARRVRFLDEVTAAVADEIGADRVGVRLSPFITFKDMDDPEILETIGLALDRLDAAGIAYVHLAEADWDDAPIIPEQARQEYRRRFRGRLIVAGGYTAESAEAVIANGHADLVAFGRAYIANPDLHHRLAVGAPLADYDMDTLFGGGARGYVDYPASAD